MSGKMLKAIRNAIVGMMNRLRMLMSLRPRLAAGEPGSSVLSTCALLLNPEPFSTGPFGHRAKRNRPGGRHPSLPRSRGRAARKEAVAGATRLHDPQEYRMTRAMRRAHLRRWRPRPHAQRTESTPRVRPSGAALQLDPSQRSRFDFLRQAPRLIIRERQIREANGRHGGSRVGGVL